MVGFIGALSSALSIFILVFITLVVSYIMAIVPETDIYKLDENTYRYPIKNYYINNLKAEEVKGFIPQLKDVEKFETKNIQVGCSIGFDLTEELARNIMVFNTIKLNGFSIPVNISMYKSADVNKEQLNFCFVDFKR